MNNRTFFLILILNIIFSITITAQTDAKVIAVINHADWCPTCRKHSERAKATFEKNNKDGSVLFLINNLTDKETRKISAIELKKYGLDEAIAQYLGTGVTYFFNSETKLAITQISLAKSDHALVAALEAAKRGLK